MKFNFPKKIEKHNIIVPLEDIIINKIKDIADVNETTSNGVVETFIVASIDEYYSDRNAPVEMVVEIEPSKPSKKASKMKDATYCQNADCRHKDQLFEESQMISVGDFLVCSEECEEVIKRASDL